MAAPRIERAVEVVCDRGEATRPRYSVGSGFLLGGPLVLTAAHNVVAGDLWVRLVGGAEHSARPRNVAADVDLALLEIDDPGFRSTPPLAVVAEVDRGRDELVERCTAVGFPRFKERMAAPRARPSRDTAHLHGVISPRASLRSHTLELQVTISPQALPPGALTASPWEGISGAVVCAHHPEHDSVVVGVIVEHHRPEGANTLTVVPLTAVTGDDRWRVQLGLAVDARLPVLPCPSLLSRSPYWATVAEVSRRTPILLDREKELAFLADFVERGGGYLRLAGDKWTGKTALVAHYALNLPPDVDGVAYFLGPNDADSGRFVEVVNDQLARLLGEDPAAATGLDAYRMRWERAVERSRRNGRHLVLVVEGIDDDAGLRRDRASVASLLPRLVSDHTHVLVTSRVNPSLPGDLDVGHPLYDAPELILRLPSEAVRARTRAIEARYGLCPTCKRNDRVEPVPRAALTESTSSEQAPVTVASALSFPPPQHERVVFRLARALTMISVLASVLAGLSESDFDQSSDADTAVALFAALALAAWIAYLVVWASRGAARRFWETLRYCHRDGVVFHLESGETFYPPDLRRHVYRRAPSPTPAPASSAPPMPSSPPSRG